MPARKPKKPKQTTQRNKADREFSLYIRERDRVCQWCGTSENLQCAHIFGRRYLKVRWDPDNAMALCAGHHKKFTHDPIAWEDFCVARMGPDKYTDLRRKAVDTLGKVDYEAVLESIEALRVREAAR